MIPLTPETLTGAIDVRPFETLGAADHGWLDAHYHFSFANYYDPLRMGWGSIRVWNDDIIAPQTGFPPHAHRDMEIITYVRSGAITHQDSMGNHGRTVAGDVQVMSAGTGVQHSEYNLENEPTTLFQIWIEPRARGGAPSWGTKPFPKSDRAGTLQLLASGYGEAEALPIRTDARIYGATLKAGQSVDFDIGQGRHAYLVIAIGHVDIAGAPINARDGAALIAGRYRMTATQDAEVVLVDAT